MLSNFIVPLLAAVVLAGQWVGPAVCMDNVSQIINCPDIEPAAISANDKKISDENTDQKALTTSVVSSKILSRSAIDTKELRIYNIANTYNESRVLSQRLNYYELPDGELLKRDFRSVKNVNVPAKTQGKDLSLAQWVTDIAPNGDENKSITDVPDDKRPVRDCTDVLSEFMFEVGTLVDDMDNTIHRFASSLKIQLEILTSNVLEFGNTMDPDISTVLIIVLWFFCWMFLAILIHIFSRRFVTVPQKHVSFGFENEETSVIIRNVYLTTFWDNENFILFIYVHASDVTNGNEVCDVLEYVYLSPGASINEIL